MAKGEVPYRLSLDYNIKGCKDKLLGYIDDYSHALSQRLLVSHHFIII